MTLTYASGMIGCLDYMKCTAHPYRVCCFLDAYSWHAATLGTHECLHTCLSIRCTQSHVQV